MDLDALEYLNRAYSNLRQELSATEVQVNPYGADIRANY